MHNKKKVKTTEDKKLERLELSKQRAKEYMQLRDKALQMKTSEDFSDEAFQVNKKMLNMASDCYSLWNFRKLIIMNLEKVHPDKKKLYNEELAWLESLLQSHPKSYWIWFHRRWLSLRMENMDWQREITLCTRALDMDQRNFHCWNYRRFVITQAKTPLKDELSYTLNKVEQNFSNYSSWHHRSYLMQKAFEDDPKSFVQVLNDELELVQNAFFTAPEDQSAWFYHRWLIGMTKKHNTPEDYIKIVEQELEKVSGLLEEEPNSKWGKLTSVFLLSALGRKTEAQSHLEALKQIDPQRKSFYQDFAVKHCSN